MNDWQKKMMFLLGMHAHDLTLAQEELGGVWIACVPMDGGISIEVESDPDTITLSVMVAPDESAEARDFLESELKDFGVKVYKNYEDFERAYHEAV